MNIHVVVAHVQDPYLGFDGWVWWCRSCCYHHQDVYADEETAVDQAMAHVCVKLLF